MSEKYNTIPVKEIGLDFHGIEKKKNLAREQRAERKKSVEIK